MTDKKRAVEELLSLHSFLVHPNFWDINSDVFETIKSSVERTLEALDCVEHIGISEKDDNKIENTGWSRSTLDYNTHYSNTTYRAFCAELSRFCHEDFIIDICNSLTDAALEVSALHIEEKSRGKIDELKTKLTLLGSNTRYLAISHLSNFSSNAVDIWCGGAR